MQQARSHRASRRSRQRSGITARRLSGRGFGPFVCRKGGLERTAKPEGTGSAGTDTAAGRWRQECACDHHAALERLPVDLSERGLDGTLESSLSAPLVQFRDSLEAALCRLRSRRFPSGRRPWSGILGSELPKKSRKSSEIKRRLRREMARAVPRRLRQVRLVRAAEVATVTRVHNEREWEQLSTKLDEQ